ncbi:MAG: magnesium transporter [Cyclobacteriaceae bacterium]
MIENLQFELSKEYLDRFKQAVDAREDTFIQESLDGVKPADISDLLSEFDSEESKYVLDLLKTEVSAEIISELDEDLREQFLDHFSADEISDYVEVLHSDDGADILNDLDIHVREEVIASLENEEKSANLVDLLRYDEDVAGGLMAKELVKANLNWNVKQCIAEIRKQAKNVQRLYWVYVVDDADTLLGKVSLKSIILAKDETKISKIYEEDVVSVETFTEEEEVAVIMQKYDLDAIPVVNVKGRLVGKITFDDIMDVMSEQAEEDRQLMTGISSDVEEDDSVWILSKARLPWLVIGLVGGLLGAWFISNFDKDIAIIPAMAFFIPLITATGGNVGIQSSSIVVQSLASPNAFEDSMMQKMIKVLFVAIVNGIILSLIVFGIVIFSTSDQTIASTVSIALFSVVLLASFMGTITPLILDKFGINPALASGPFITTANDLLGLGVYFAVAHALYGL